MNEQQEQIRDQQKATWNKFSPGWKKWDELTMRFLKPMGDEIINRLAILDGNTVLDIAAGTGEPGLNIASMIPNGKVTITDLAEGMLDVARAKAATRGLHNVEFKIADVSALPFDDNTFDAISCRMGYMFFPDMALATREMARVLKPGGRLATSVWNAPAKNFWVTSMMSTINKNIETPAPPVGAPGMFRCAEPSMIANFFAEAGLTAIKETEINERLLLGSAETFWNFHTDVAAPVVAALNKADETMKKKIKKEVFEALHDKYKEGEIYLDYSARVISGIK
jgi:ubiquinone/menaquinone biosynthesis C-methylase UbiE